MRGPKPNAERVAAANARGRARREQLLQSAFDILEDARREERAAAGLCLLCFYQGEAALHGQAFTPWRCECCGLEGTHGNTGVPRYCSTCAKRWKLCPKCGASTTRVAQRRDPCAAACQRVIASEPENDLDESLPQRLERMVTRLRLERDAWKAAAFEGARLFHELSDAARASSGVPFMRMQHWAQDMFARVSKG